MRYAILVVWAMVLAACGEAYTTPGGAADFSQLGLTPQEKAALTDSSVQRILDKKPLATFPATLAIARVQAADYESYSYRNGPRAYGAYAVITTRDIEKDADFDAIARLPRVAAVAGMKRILLSQNMNSDLDLRTAAAKLHANLLLFYTLDTTFSTDTALRPLEVISLGLVPNKNAKVTTTASAVLMDVSNGYVYGAYEATEKDNQLASAWTNDDALDQVRQRTERKAFESLIRQFTSEWPTVLATYDHHAASAAAQ